MATSKHTAGEVWLTAIILSVIFIVAANARLMGLSAWRPFVFVLTLILVALVFAAIGRLVNDRPAGLIIDNRNRASLSKLQMIAWTVLVIGALTCLAASRLANAAPGDPLDISIPTELLEAMGIAATSFVAAPAVLSLKAGETPTQDNLSKAAAAASADGAQLQANGKLHGRADPSQAQWMDLFRGDEIGNADKPDLSKIQQFAITALLIGVYVANLIDLFADPSNFAAKAFGGDAKHFPNALPALSNQFVVLMAISHASYLIYKAVPHTSTGDDSASTGDGGGTQADGSVG